MTSRSIPLWELDALMKGIVEITAVDCPIETAVAIPTADELNALFRSKQYAEAFRVLGNLPNGIEITLWVPVEHHTPFHPSGSHLYFVDNPDQWQFPLLVMSESQNLQKHILEDSLQLLTAARMNTEQPRNRSAEGWDLSNPPGGSIQENAVLHAIAHLVNAYGAACICHPLTPNTISLVSDGELVELSTDPEVTSLWRYIIQRRVVASSFDDEVEALVTKASFDKPLHQKLANDLHIEFPAFSTLLATKGSRTRQFEDKLVSVVTALQSDNVRRIATHDFEPGEIGMNREKIPTISWLKAQLERERSGIKEGIFERIRNKWILG